MRPLVWQAILQPAEMKVPATALQFDALGCRNQLRRFSLQQDVCYWMNHEAASAVSGDMGGRGVATINTAIEVRGGFLLCSPSGSRCVTSIKVAGVAGDKSE